MHDGLNIGRGKRHALNGDPDGAQPQKTRCPRLSRAAATALSAFTAAVREVNGPIPFIRS